MSLFGSIGNFFGDATDWLFGSNTEQVNQGNTDYAQRLAQQQYDASQYNQLFGQQQQQLDQLGQMSAFQNTGGQFSGYATGASGLDAFMAYSPQMQEIAFGQTSQMQDSLNQQAADQARLATQTAGAQFANMGAERSGAAYAAMGEAAARPFADVQNQLGMQAQQYNAQLQSQLLGQTTESARLGTNQALQESQFGRSMSSQQQQFDMNYQLALAQQNQQLLGMEQQNQQNAFNAIQGLGQPTYVQGQSGMDMINTGVTTGATIATLFSDKRLKKDIRTVKRSGKIVDRLRGVFFKWRATGAQSGGVIAQEVEKVLPEAVQKDTNGTYSVSYGALIGVLIEEVKDLRKRVKKLEGT